MVFRASFYICIAVQIIKVKLLLNCFTKQLRSLDFLTESEVTREVKTLRYVLHD